jgi:hypothetical protein
VRWQWDFSAALWLLVVMTELPKAVERRAFKPNLSGAAVLLLSEWATSGPDTLLMSMFKAT